MKILQSGTSRTLALASLLVLATTACSSGSRSSSGDTSPTSPNSVAADASGTQLVTADSAAQAERQFHYSGPLSDLLFGQQQDAADQQAADDAMEQQVEDLTASCMQTLGFTYTPYIAVYAKTPFDDAATMDPGEYARQYGYGMSTIDYPTAPSNPDPNAAAVAAMSPAQRSAYYQALDGATTVVDDQGNPVVGKPAARPAGADPSTDSDAGLGCAAEASTTVYGSKQEQDAGSQFASLEQSMGALGESIETDPRVVAATSAWIGCMADAGHPGYTEKTDAPGDVSSHLTTLRGDADDLSNVAPADLADLRAFEIDVATADYVCGIAFDAVHQSVETELENTFIDQNRTELEQYRDATAAGTAGHG